MNAFGNLIPRNKLHICLGSGFWEIGYEMEFSWECSQKQHLWGSEGSGSGRKGSATVLPFQQGSWAFPLGSSWAGAPAEECCEARVWAFYPHMGQLLYLSSVWRERINLGEVFFSEGHSWERTYLRQPFQQLGECVRQSWRGLGSTPHHPLQHLIGASKLSVPLALQTIPYSASLFCLLWSRLVLVFLTGPSQPPLWFFLLFPPHLLFKYGHIH